MLLERRRTPTAWRRFDRDTSCFDDGRSSFDHTFNHRLSALDRFSNRLALDDWTLNWSSVDWRAFNPFGTLDPLRPIRTIRTISSWLVAVIGRPLGTLGPIRTALGRPIAPAVKIATLVLRPIPILRTIAIRPFAILPTRTVAGLTLALRTVVRPSVITTIVEIAVVAKPLAIAVVVTVAVAVVKAIIAIIATVAVTPELWPISTILTVLAFATVLILEIRIATLPVTVMSAITIRPIAAIARLTTGTGARLRHALIEHARIHHIVAHVLAGLVVAELVAPAILAVSAEALRLAIGITRLLQLLADLRRNAGVRRPVRLTQAAGLASPVALGWNEIVLPEAALTELDATQQKCLLAHELAHTVQQSASAGTASRLRQ